MRNVKLVLRVFILIFILGNKLYATYESLEFIKNWECRINENNPRYRSTINDFIHTRDKEFVVVGQFYPTYNTGTEILIIKIDKKGNELWRKTFSNTGDYDVGSAVVEDVDRNLIIISTLKYQSECREVNLIKLNKNGDVLWNKNLNIGTNDSGNDLTIGYSNSLVITGSTVKKGQNGSSLLIMELNLKNGNTKWIKTFDVDKDGSYRGYSIVRTYNGYVIAGSTYFNRGRDNDVFVLKVDKSGNELWRQVFDANSKYSYIGRNGSMIGKSITTDLNNTVVACKGGESGREYDYLIKFDKNGNVIWDYSSPDFYEVTRFQSFYLVSGLVFKSYSERRDGRLINQTVKYLPAVSLFNDSGNRIACEFFDNPINSAIQIGDKQCAILSKSAKKDEYILTSYDMEWHTLLDWNDRKRIKEKKKMRIKKEKAESAKRLAQSSSNQNRYSSNSNYSNKVESCEKFASIDFEAGYNCIINSSLHVQRTGCDISTDNFYHTASLSGPSSNNNCIKGTYSYSWTFYSQCVNLGDPDGPYTFSGTFKLDGKHSHYLVYVQDGYVKVSGY